MGTCHMRQKFIASEEGNHSKAKQISQGHEHVQSQPENAKKHENAWENRTTFNTYFTKQSVPYIA